MSIRLDRNRCVPPRFSYPFLAFVITWSCWMTASTAQAQGSTDHLPGKIYVVRISPYFADREFLERDYRASLKEQFQHTGGMLDHITERTYVVQSATDERWFLVYFNRDRQAKEDLMQDADLLVWGLHGHDVQIMPIELLRSPISSLAATVPGR